MSALSSSTVWLTGASSGIGESLAKELSQRGAALALTARRQEQLEEVAEPLQAGGAQIHVLPGDVTDRDRMHAIARDLEQRWGRIDIGLFNAGVYEPISPDTFDAEVFRRHLDVNFMGTIHGIEAVLSEMRRRRSGRIAVVSSLTGYAAFPRAEAYGATKAALISMCESLRADVAADGVSVTLIAPGFVRTPATEQNEFEMPFLIESDEAARIIADGLEAEKDEIAFPLRMSLFAKGLGSLPGPVARRYTARMAERLRTEHS